MSTFGLNSIFGDVVAEPTDDCFAAIIWQKGASVRFASQNVKHWKGKVIKNNSQAEYIGIIFRGN
jgi:hypothetical protein